jgi:hypothetical protein
MAFSSADEFFFQCAMRSAGRMTGLVAGRKAMPERAKIAFCGNRVTLP